MTAANPYRGVSWHKNRKKWRAKVKQLGKHYDLGYHDDAETAARVYDYAARLLHGGDAVVNFDGQPPGDMCPVTIRRRLERQGVKRFYG